MTQPETQNSQPRRHVVGFILGSIIVGVIGLVNHRRNRSGQRHNPRRFIDYRLENF